MPAPTALLRQNGKSSEAETAVSSQMNGDEGGIFVDFTSTTPSAQQNKPSKHVDSIMRVNEEGHPTFPPAKVEKFFKVDTRKIAIPPQRMTPLKSNWSRIYPPLVEHLKLQVRMNLSNRAIEMRTSRFTVDPGAVQKGADFVRAFCLGFDLEDAIAMLRLDDLYIESFEIKDVKSLSGEHRNRAIGRIAGKGGTNSMIGSSSACVADTGYQGKTKFAIENASKTRVVLADQTIHVLGGFRNIHLATEAICNLILGSPPSKVYGNLRAVASRMRERF